MMSEEPLERRGRSSSMGRRPSPPRSSPINLNPSNSKNTPRPGQRLRAATSFSSYHPPSSMAIRHTGITGGGNGGTIGKSLAAIAGPMGITIVDVAAPQRPWLVLNYSSSLGCSTSSSGINSGGISTMAFQPCTSTVQRSVSDVDSSPSSSPSYRDNSSNYSQSSSPILLATARGNGILIWDCSGRALSPLLGRLNASDSWSGCGGGGVNSKTINGVGNNNSGSKRNVDDESMESSESGPNPTTNPSPLPLVKPDSNASSAAQDALKSMVCSPKSMERKASLVSVSSSSSLVTYNITNLNTANTPTNLTSTTTGPFATKNSTISSSPKGNVTSLDWKGPSAPILLSTCGMSASIWDLRTSLFSGVGGSGGARPNARFVSPEDGLYHTDSSLIHCAYSHDESNHTFATLDSIGVVRMWDDRKADVPKHSFLACTGGGVGIASVAPPRMSADAGPRWITWGMDDGQGYSDDLVVKVWTESSTTGRNEDGGENCTPYHVTSRISMAGGVAARVHPSFSDGILLFRSSHSEKESSLQQTTGGLPTPTGLDVSAGEIDEGTEGRVNSPGQMVGLKMRASPEMAVVQTPPSPPPLMLEGTARVRDPEESASSHVHHEGWEAELWLVDDGGGDEAGGEEKEGGTVGAQKVTEFHGGGDEEDALSFPNLRDVSDVIAVDLALSAPVDSNVDGNARQEELSLCVLTKAGRLTVYGAPEASDLLAQEKATETTPNKQGRVDIVESNLARPAVAPRVYRQGIDQKRWWNNNEEEEIFGISAHDSPKKSSMESLTSVAERSDALASSSAVRGVQITEPTSATPSIIPDVDLAASMDEVASERDLDTSATGDVQNNIPIDPAMAARVPCPPLCGVAFSGVGELVTFNNGPVTKLWSYYQSNESDTPPGPSFSNSRLTLSATSDEEDSSIHNQNLTGGSNTKTSPANQALPRTLGDLIEMNLRSQTLQWGDEQQNNANDDGSSSSSSDGSSSYEDAELMVLESDESGGVSDSDDSESEGFYHVSSNEGNQRDLDILFDDYFSRKSLLGTENEESCANEEKFAGLPSLSPSVTITREYEDIILNGQTPKLSNLLKLGDVWWLTKDFTVPGSEANERHANNIDGLDDNTTFPRKNSSDPYLSSSPFSDRALARSSSFSPANIGGSMIGSLKKLFAHQLPTAMTPPDQRLLNSKATQKSSQIDQSTIRPDPSTANLEGPNPVHLGVYMLENPQTPEAGSERLAIARKLCIHNAQVYSDCGQKAKADTWTLLAQTIESIFTFEMDETDGWGGDGDALTDGLVEQILRYYEVLGDFQMLSTIVCVLTFGRDRRDLSRHGGGRYQLLPKFDERRYDNYVRQYSALLYGWGVLTTRSEISKRLAYSNSGVAPGVTFSPLCGGCMEPVTDANTTCPKCKDYAFQCSICCSAVRGACTWCPLCGHGGHIDHMMQWFQKQKVCPTGCGCVCMLGNPSPTQPRTDY